MFPREQLMRHGKLDSHGCAVIEPSRSRSCPRRSSLSCIRDSRVSVKNGPLRAAIEGKNSPWSLETNSNPSLGKHWRFSNFGHQISSQAPSTTRLPPATENDSVVGEGRHSAAAVQMTLSSPSS